MEGIRRQADQSWVVGRGLVWCLVVGAIGDLLGMGWSLRCGGWEFQTAQSAVSELGPRSGLRRVSSFEKRIIILWNDQAI